MLRIIIYLSFLTPLVFTEVQFVMAIWRHGDRAPEKLPYPNDVHNETEWPRGWNQLTNLGITQTFQLGQWFKKRYIDATPPLINKKFSRHEVVYRSTDVERAIQSALSHSTGMFPAVDDFVWTTDQGLRAWQPIPIHTNGIGKDDPLLKPTSIKCNKYKELVNNKNGPLMVNYSTKYQELFDLLSLHAGYNVTIDNVKKLYDITREQEHKLPQPKWIDEKWNNQTILEHIKELKKITRTSEFNSVEKSKYRAGILINDWCDKLQGAANGSLTEKAYLYSSHDGTLSALSYAMGISDNELIPYAASYIAELHNNNGQHTVQLFYRKSSEDLQQVKLVNCTVDCPLDQFLEQLEGVRIRTVEELHQMCDSAVINSIISLFVFTLFYWL